MTAHMSEDFSTKLIDGSLFAIVDDTIPPRDPEDDDEDEDEEDEDEEDEPPVVREPDED
ncbi:MULTISPECIES: hypothetical protein [unclassified Bradyrhizobium]|uniref:hypothetical protein n=1 Tax=unclassified Bradyrhizobium TaxID=2631580 RepID=UPI002FF0C0A8